MPTVARFNGVAIRFYPRDHQPPHFHAFHGDQEAVITIKSARLAMGALPPAVLSDVLDWTQRHQAELLEDWKLCRNHQPTCLIAYP